MPTKKIPIVLLCVFQLIFCVTGKSDVESSEFDKLCAKETIQAFIGENDNAIQKQHHDPYKMCNDLQRSCCSKEIFTRGYNRFSDALRKPIVERLKEFKAIQKMLYKIDLRVLESLLLSIKKRKPRCSFDNKKIIDDLSEVKLNKAHLHERLTQIYNGVLQMYSGVLCAACNPAQKSMFVVNKSKIDHTQFLILKARYQVCSKHISSQLAMIDLVEKLKPLFMLSKILNCNNGLRSEHLYKNFDMPFLSNQRGFLQQCQDPKTNKSSSCLSFCSYTIDFVSYDDKFSLLANIEDTYRTLYFILNVKPHASTNGAIEATEDGRRYDYGELGMNKFGVFSFDEQDKSSFEHIELVLNQNEGVNFDEDLMKKEFYKSVTIAAASALVIITVIKL